MANPLEITYGDVSVGGESQVYLLHNPYRLQKAFLALTLSFDVIVTAIDREEFLNACEELEDGFSERFKDLTITFDGREIVYEYGKDLMNTVATISKPGSPETDRGYSRMYVVTITGDLPPTPGDGGLLHFDVNTSYNASRQKTVTFSGVYLPTKTETALQAYQRRFGAEARTILSMIDSAATWELVDESPTMNRTQQTLQFTQQYVELLFNQSQGALDDSEVKDHRVVFTDLSQYPGESEQNIRRLHRVVARYDCAIDKEESQDVKQVFEDKVLPHIKATFREEFSPQAFAIEDQTANYDYTGNRLSSTVQFVYQLGNQGSDIVEVSKSLAYREQRTIDYTPVHEQDEFAAEADPGTASRERIWRRTVVVKGDEIPKMRVAERPKIGPAGPFAKAVEGDDASLDGGSASGSVRGDGWNIVANESEVTDRWIGLPGEDDQLKLSVLTETIIERFHKKPTGRTSSARQ